MENLGLMKQSVHLKNEIELAEKAVFFSYWSLIARFLWVVSVLTSYQIGFNTAETQFQQSTTSKNRVVTIIHKNLGSKATLLRALLPIAHFWLELRLEFIALMKLRAL